MTLPSSAADATVFRDTLSRFASGVVVVTGATASRPAGLTCQSFFSVSLDPPLIAISASINSRSWQAIAETGRFAVSVLNHDQQQLCMDFGRGGVLDKFATVAWRPAPSGAPLIHGALAWLDCAIEAVHPAGDHLVVIGRVDFLSAADGEPLLFHRGSFGAFARNESTRGAQRVSLDTDADDVWGSGLWLQGVDW